MTLLDLVPMLQSIGFDCSVTPPKRDDMITLAELEYDEIDQYWHFRFRWPDITLNVAPSEIPPEIWRIIGFDASAGDTDTMIYGISKSINYSEDSTVEEISEGLREEIERFTEYMQGLIKIVKRWM